MSSEKEEKKRRIRPKFQPIQPKVREDNLTIDYEKMELEHLLPELTREIHEKQDQRLTFHEVVEELEDEQPQEPETTEEMEQIVDIQWEMQRDKELRNPDAISFIRRCSTINEAQEIIDYLEKRGELTPELASKYRDQLLSSGLESFGPKKEPGYYEKVCSRRAQLRKIKFG
ncbi:MAG: hypothetical protein RBG13Loki_1499 [Promethearchaeota archaeon CR_4]|nr:MAG: hypothetical protein RBG13Loki_1499 [Candidatus Lokiarchaeota archaeon CR_4]